MALPPLATVSAMETRLGVPQSSLEGEDLARAGAALDDASTLIRAAAGTDWVAEDGVTITAPSEVIAVATQVALRVYRNPEGLSGEAVDGYSWQTRNAGLYLTDAESLIVANASSGGSSASRSFVGSVRTPSAYAPHNEPIPDFWGL